VVIPALLVVVLAVLIGTGPAFIGQRTEALPVEPTPYVKAEDAGATMYNLALFFVLLVAATAVIYIMFTRGGSSLCSSPSSGSCFPSACFSST